MLCADMSVTVGETTSQGHPERGGFPRRTLLKAALGAGALVVGGKALERGLNILNAPGELEAAVDKDPFFKPMPTPDTRPAATRTTTYSLKELTSQREANAGDSGEVGYIEGSTETAAPEAIMCATMNSYLGSNEAWEFIPEAAVGKTLQDIAPQVTQLVQRLASDRSNAPLTIGYGAGGNDVLAFLAQWEGDLINPPGSITAVLNEMKKYWPDFLAVFKEMYKGTLQQIATLNASTQDQHAPADKRVKRVFIRGLPNPMNMTPGPDETIVEHFFASPIRKIALALTSQVNVAIMDIIDEVQVQYPGVDFCYQSAWNIPLYGIHATKKGYMMLVLDRMQRSMVEGRNTNFIGLVGGQRNLVLPPQAA